MGRVHEPSFRLVLTDSKNSTKSGRFKEILGSYDPRKSVDSFNAERIQYWLSKGAGLTATVNNLLIKNKIITGKKIDVSAKSKKEPVPIEVAADKAEVKEKVAEEASKEEVSKKEEVAPAEEATPATKVVGVEKVAKEAQAEGVAKEELIGSATIIEEKVAPIPAEGVVEKKTV